MQALKALVIGMGVLIVAGVAILVYGLTGKLGDVAEEQDPNPSAPFGTIRVEMPAGATVRDATLDGDRMVVRLLLPDGGARLMVFRLSDGRQIGAVEFQPNW